MSEKLDIEKKKCQTPEFRVSFPHLFEPHSFAGKKPQYSLTMLFPKKVDLTALRRAAHNAATEKWGPKEKWPKNLDMPFRDGDKPNKKGNAQPEGYAGCTFIVAKSKTRKPGVIGPVRDVDTKEFPVLTTEAEFYAGCYARANVLAYAYAHESGTAGVGFNLQGVQKLRDGKEFSGNVDIQSSFDEVITSSDDESSYDSDGEGADAGMGF